MTISAGTIYLLSLVGNLNVAAIITIIFSGCLCFAQIIAIMAGNEIGGEAKIIKWGSVIFTIALLICVLLPSKREIAAMFVVPAIVNNEKVQNITSNGLDILEGLTKEWLEDMAQSKKKEAAND